MKEFLRKEFHRPAQRLACVACSMIFWYLFAHGYRFSNDMFAHDTLLNIYQVDSAWQIALGRVLQPVLIFLRGGICSPWLISFGAVVWLSLSAWLIVDMLDVKKMVSIIMITGAMACNPMLISLNSSFLPWVDFFMLAMFLAVAGVWACRKGTFLWLTAGAVLMAVSMGIYQSYISVSIVLIIILLMGEMRQNADFKSVVKKVFSYVIPLAAAALLYYIMWQTMRRIFGIWVSDSYNGLASLGDYTEMSLFSAIALAYQTVFYRFFHPAVFVTMPFRGRSLSFVWNHILLIANVVAAGSLPVHIILRDLKKKMKWWQYLIQALLILMLPAGINFIGIISKGNDHILTIYALVLVYVFAVAEAERAAVEGVKKNDQKDHLWKSVILWLAMLCVIWSNVVYANQAYLKRELQEKATASFMTRIVTDIEKTEGYEPGVTPVAFYGPFAGSPYLQDMEGLEDILPYGMSKTPLTYGGTEEAFIKYELGVPVNCVRTMPDDPAIADMPSYPAEGSIAYVGDVLVVKIADIPR